ncbi:unnamed protein product [Brassica oleracea var. botrytis]|nr:unnamed protein product [Brassica napus]VDD04853.1 unnamed protein product [Brassica oleracea]
MSKLNSNALPFRTVHTDEHALFLTFSNGFPLTEVQILHYFNWQLMIIISYYYPYVEGVNVHIPKIGRQPLFGKIVFRKQCIPALLMGNKEKIYFIVDGCHLYCKRFVTQKSKPAATESTSLPDDGNHSDGDE